MYNNYKLVTLLLNTKGGASETIEALTKEVDGAIVPCTKEEAMLKLYDKMSKTGGNASVQSIKCILLDANGGQIKVEELVKPVIAE